MSIIEKVNNNRKKDIDEFLFRCVTYIFDHRIEKNIKLVFNYLLTDSEKEYITSTIKNEFEGTPLNLQNL